MIYVFRIRNKCYNYVVLSKRVPSSNGKTEITIVVYEKMNDSNADNIYLTHFFQDEIVVTFSHKRIFQNAAYTIFISIPCIYKGLSLPLEGRWDKIYTTYF